MFHMAKIGKYLTLGAMVVFALGCSKKADESSSAEGAAKVTIQNAGSDTMVNLAQAWSEEYSKVMPDVSVEVSGGGSGTGIAALINGTADVVNSSREMSPEEKEKATQSAGGQAPQEYIAGYDALAVYVHKDNPLNEIGVDQLSEIYGEGGKIEKWSQLGAKNTVCPSDKIIRVSRQSNSGTYVYFREHVVGRDYKLGQTDLHGSKDVVDLVGKTPCAIGYSGLAYATPEVKKLLVAKKAGETAYEANVENTLNKAYPIARPLYIYTHGVPNEAVKKYIDWILSDAGQQVVESIGYVPLPKPAAATTGASN
jgi:phosphate transport system substrate-binding protein